MLDEPAEQATSWKQWKLPQLNLGTLVSVLIAVGFITWQGLMIRAQIDDNSEAVGSMAFAVEELAGAVSLANELDTRTNQMFSEIENLRDQYQDQADVWIEISTQAEQIATMRDEARILRTDIESTWNQQNEFRIGITARIGEFEAAGQALSDLQWQVDDLNRRVAEAVGAEMASGGDDYGWQITDLQRMVAEIQGRQNAGVDIEWKLEDLESSVDRDIDDLARQLTDLRVRVETSGGVEQWEIDDLYIRTDEMFDLIWRMFAALDSRSWAGDYLHG